ncbi:HdeA/HdeB family chaperone [Aestuariivirga litoralis]|uniref:HdeA/HdeB family chaperone n=1 Tax=Aestuariivirga litoralis TaxID=2650924 RepID=UPI0018C71173|nr:HdeA/HdeB family chaperone [Aestuariivirga litoralis]MBG1231850.1 hypothetical protein [Aestuariivirga litoralis]
MKKILILAALACAFGAGTANAGAIDAATIKCSERTTIAKEDLSYILFWMYGFLNGKADDTTIDIDGYTKIADKIVKKCDENPDLGLLTVMGAVLEEK